MLPSLERLGIQPTIFVCTDYAGRRPAARRCRCSRAYPLSTATSWPRCAGTSLRELAERGIEVGSHTSTHPNLRELSDR